MLRYVILRAAYHYKIFVYLIKPIMQRNKLSLSVTIVSDEAFSHLNLYSVCS